MQSVSSNAVAQALGGTLKLYRNFSVKLTTFNSWQTLFDCKSVDSGIYAIRIYLNDNSTWWSENLSTVIYLYAGITNSANASTVYFNQSGHASNTGVAQLRILRKGSGTAPNNYCAFQINLNTGNANGVNIDAYLYKIA